MRQHQMSGARNRVEEKTGRERRMLVLRPGRPVEKMDLTNIAFWLHKDCEPATRPLKPRMDDYSQRPIEDNGLRGARSVELKGKDARSGER